jgi:two-component sensor histidine kinase
MEHHVIDYGEYMPHGMCLLWEPWLVLLWAGSDLLIFLSYTAIPVALFMVLRRRTEMPQPALVLLFAAFILMCGITHLFMIVTLWVPIYPFVGVFKLATGLVSIATAVMLFRLIPVIVRLPSPAALETVNRGLRDEIAAHEATLASLDLQVRERTADLERATTALAVQTREAVHRSSNLLSVVHTLALQSAKGSRSLSDFLDPFLGRVRALAVATRSVSADGEARARLSAVVEAALAVAKATYGDRIDHSGPPLDISQTAAQQLSLALHELATNTHKYGLGASDALRVSVTWSVTGEDFALLWHEHGGAAAPSATTGEQKADGFGTTLLMSIVPATLRGKAERRFDAEGMTYRLVAPLVAIRDLAPPWDDTGLASRIIETSFGNE